MPEREYILAAEPTVQNVGGQVQRFREVRERAGDGPWQVAAVVSDGDSVAVLDALRRAYADGREDRAEEECIVRWHEVRKGDRVLSDGQLETVDQVGAVYEPGNDSRMHICLSGRWHAPKREDFTAIIRREEETR